MRLARRSAARVVLAYVLFAMLWICFSDRLAGALISDHALLVDVSTYKGIVFVVITAGLLYVLITRMGVHTAGIEDRLRVVHDLVPAFLERTPDATFVKDAEGRYVLLNSAAAAVMGRSVEEARGLDDAALFSPEQATMMRAFDLEVMQTGAVRTVERTVKASDGTEVVYLATKVPLSDADGRVSGVLGISRDITARRRMETTLAASEARFHALFDHMQEGFAFCELVFDDQQRPIDFVYLEVNEAFARVTGLPDVKGKRVTEVIPNIWVTHPELLECYGRVALGGRPDVFDIEFKPLGGWFSISVYSTERGYFATVVANITERKRAEDALRDTSRRLQLATRATGLGVWDLDPESSVLLWDDRMHEIFGVPRGTFGGTRDAWAARLHPDDRDLTLQALEAALAEARELEIRYRIVRPDGSARNLRSSGTILRDGDGRAVRVIGMVADETERLNLEAQLRQAQKMEAVGQLAGGVAHDFNNMLMAITGYADLLAEELPPGSNLRTFVDEILASSGRAASLTHDLLAFGRRTVMHRVQVDVNQMLHGLEKMLSRIIGEDITVRVKTPPHPVLVMVDQGHVEHALLNLATNARDAMPAGGTLDLSASYVSFERPGTVRGDTLAAGDYARISVADTGTGMDAVTLERLFEPFYTTKEVGKGSGLGLAMVYGTIRQQGGGIDVVSHPGGGTRFDVYLPRAGGAASQPTPVPQALLPGHETLLVVEDDADARRVTRLLLESLGYRVVLAADGEESLRVFEQHRDEVALVLSDIVMPRVNGLELQQALREVAPDLPVLFMSGYPANVLAERGVDPGTIELLQKPLRREHLSARLRQLLDAR